MRSVECENSRRAFGDRVAADNVSIGEDDLEWSFAHSTLLPLTYTFVDGMAPNSLDHRR